jgi:hypothetical protein
MMVATHIHFSLDTSLEHRPKNANYSILVGIWYYEVKLFPQFLDLPMKQWIQSQRVRITPQGIRKI